MQYESAFATVEALTRALSQGGAVLETKNPLPVGTRFAFELLSPELPNTKLQLAGTVLEVVEQGIDVDGEKRFGLVIEYRFDSEEDRSRVQSAIERLLAIGRNEMRREFPRVPTAYRVRDPDDPLGAVYVMRNLSEGGMLLELASGLGGDTASVGQRARLEVVSGERTWTILGTIAWTVRTGVLQLGVQFDPGVRQIVKDLMAMRAQPDALRIHFA